MTVWNCGSSQNSKKIELFSMTETGPRLCEKNCNFVFQNWNEF
ncbi:hypothetical protein HMPREF1545_02639 [Oscillibacter sp. KLE 1728]|nr:hypothetical protein HMPREF1545_02639 [Oscillibacter sp. KLE 1728]ERK59703.1 hypothetical protein HMPREF1546_03291 [Oscillibacter sp. KLE 1745]